MVRRSRGSGELAGRSAETESIARYAIYSLIPGGRTSDAESSSRDDYGDVSWKRKALGQLAWGLRSGQSEMREDPAFCNPWRSYRDWRTCRALSGVVSVSFTSFSIQPTANEVSCTPRPRWCSFFFFFLVLPGDNARTPGSLMRMSSRVQEEIRILFFKGRVNHLAFGYDANAA